ncbi:hypothetical protein BUALT_Bualt18G0079300 [Buddleja alternifolia]|uniref:Uncharacterized protein n=1 Tax=Buddleja alternifolia TaxID=168488 RepID=A0AAV6W9S3_9LAMI|nr:hypothetical protein BUALT_Bualt18G0079300 [Buddleja alternifolia]
MVLVDNEVANDNLGDREWDNAVFNEILGNKGVEPQDNLTSHRPENELEESDSSFISDCSSWMLEDFEGPMDDDIFANKAPDHAITIFKTLRAFIKEKKKRRAAERQLELIIRRDVDGEGWFSDAPAEEEDDIESLRVDEEKDNGKNSGEERRHGKDVYLRVYSHSINPIPGMHDFEEFSLGKVLAPKVKIGVGRPKKKRIRDGNDIGGTSGPRKGLTHTCSICGELGHNKAGHDKHRRQSELPLQFEDEGVPPSPSILISSTSI